MIRIVFLGTGAALPTKARKSSAVALQHGGAITLFDCGEGAQFQLQKSDLHQGKIQNICITHLHGDHLFGLPGLLASFQLLGRKEPLRIFAPQRVEELLYEIMRLTGLHCEFEIQFFNVTESDESAKWDINDSTIEARPLDHTCFCMGFRYVEKDRPGKFDVEKAEALGIPLGPIRQQLVKGSPVMLNDGTIIEPAQVVGPSQPGRSIAYCVDTRPCQNTRILAKNVDLLIHDSTFAGNEEERAAQAGHSTSIQAAHIAREAGVKRLALTHLSGRYEDDDPEVLEACQEFFPNSIIAHDLMSIEL